MKVYLTTGLFIIVSWISFIVPPEVVPGNTDNLHTCITIIILDKVNSANLLFEF